MPKRLQAGRSRNTVRIPQFACFIDSHRLAQFASWPPRARHIRAATPSTLLSFFCKNHDQKVIPIWAKHSMAVCSLPPSEAAPERVFALAVAHGKQVAETALRIRAQRRLKLCGAPIRERTYPCSFFLEGTWWDRDTEVVLSIPASNSLSKHLGRNQRVKSFYLPLFAGLRCSCSRTFPRFLGFEIRWFIQQYLLLCQRK